jgi:hypothetical protein
MSGHDSFATDNSPLGREYEKVVLHRGNSTQPPVAMEQIKRPTPRQELLDQAYKITSSDRNKAYGNPEDNFNIIAGYWNMYLRTAGVSDSSGRPLYSHDVAYLMVLMKMARLNTNPMHHDSLVDVAGYAACAADCQAAGSIPHSQVNKT